MSDRCLTDGSPVTPDLRHQYGQMVMCHMWADTQKTVRVRIPVAVDSAGKWHAVGYFGQTDAANAKMAADCWLFKGTHPNVYFIETDIPLPGAAIDGIVEPRADLLEAAGFGRVE